MKLLIVSVTSLFLAIAANAAPDRPNFLIIFIDDMGYGDLGCFGGFANARTPHIDRLADEGTRFTSFYAQTVCGPSRGALMTGRYPHRVGGGWITNGEEVTVAEVLKTAGYTTACIGKWDMSKRRYQEALVPNSQGFDHYYGALGANDGNRVTLHENRQELETTEDMAGLTKRYTGKSIEFLKANHEKPFFLYLAHTMMHVVIDASPEYRDRSGKGLYADTLEELDAETGRLLATLDELGLQDNTVVLFTSDNGPWNNDHRRQHAKNARFVDWTKGPELPWGEAGPLRGAKGSTWEGGIRVPGILRWPGKVPAGRESGAIVSTLDVMPTFAALAGATDAVPADRVIDGVNQTNLWLGKSENGARDGFWYFDDGELQAVRQGPWKLRLPALKKLRTWPEFDRGSQETELYNLERDLGETKNVATNEPEIVAKLMAIAEEAKPAPIVEFEAESFKAQTANNVRSWAITKAKSIPGLKPDPDPPHLTGASKRAYIEALPDTRSTHADKLVHGENFSPEAGKMAILTYRVHFPKAGKYYVWARAFSTGTEDNGFHIGLNGEWPESGQRWQTVEKRRWHWECKQRTEKVHTGVPMQLFLDIPSAGEHEIQISMREDGCELDKFILAMDRSYRPPGYTRPAKKK